MAEERKIYKDSKTSFDDDESFSRLPLTSYYSSDDFSNRAVVKVDNENINLDLLVQSVDMQFAENHQVEEHIGNTFSTWFFGKAPMDINVTASMPDNNEVYGKQDLIKLYLSTLSLNAVARTGKCPELHVKNFIIYGPWTSIKISESSTTPDLLAVLITIMVLQLTSVNVEKADYEAIKYDFIHGDAHSSNSSSHKYKDSGEWVEDETEASQEASDENTTTKEDKEVSISQDKQYNEQDKSKQTTTPNKKDNAVEVSREVKDNMYGGFLV